MSVINKMLRDLDHRQPTTGSVPSAQGDLRQGTVSLSGLGARVGPGKRWGWVAAGATCVLGLAVLFWVWSHAPAVGDGSSQKQVTSAEAVTSPQPDQMATPTVEPNQAASTAPLPQISVPTASYDMQLRMDPTLGLRNLLEVELAPAPATPTPTPTGKPVSNERPAPQRLAAVASASPVTAPTSSVTDPVQAEQRQQKLVQDAIAHAQGLWTAGSRDTAIELLQEVLATTERVANQSGVPPNTQLLQLQVRELTRMQLAASRPGAAMDLLVRLEPLLGNQADLWAVRANAAQRLGRHQDSVHAYMMALQSRPNEQRWLLGAAVSLAALGQVTGAGEMADKARLIGPISKDVLYYLHQMGVP